MLGSALLAAAAGSLIFISSSSGPFEVHVKPPASVVRRGGAQLAEFERGARVLASSGCLACHRLAVWGNRGPGRDLTSVGSRLSRREIEHVLLRPSEPMPSFKHLPREKLRALVTFLSLLRAKPPHTRSRT